MFDLLRLYEIHGIGDPGSILNLGIRGIEIAVENVLEDRVVEENWLLHDEGHCMAEGLQVVIFDINIIDCEFAIVQVVEAHDQGDNGGFATT
jgi:hypothetical protein